MPCTISLSMIATPPPSIGPRGKVYYREGLQEPEHTLEVSLQPDRKYYWSVRMRRGEEVSEWSRFDYRKIVFRWREVISTLEYPFFFFQTPVISQADSTTVQVVQVIDGDTIQVCCIARKRGFATSASIPLRPNILPKGSNTTARKRLRLTGSWWKIKP